MFGVILAPSSNTLSSAHSDGSMTKMISINDDEEPIWESFHEIPMEFVSSCKESLDKDTPEARIVKNVVDQKN
jgi:hypothetical protein